MPGNLTAEQWQDVVLPHGAEACNHLLSVDVDLNTVEGYEMLSWETAYRTCALRVIGHGSSLRVENRVPGGDVNPYLAIAAIIAGGLHGLEHELPLPEPLSGNAYTADVAHLPTSLREAAALFAESAIARNAFGGEVVDHYLNQARIEVEAFDAAVTDWERVRGFERL